MLCIVCFEGPKIIHICEPLSYSKEGMEMEELMELIVFIWIPRPPNRNVEILLLRPVPIPDICHGSHGYIRVKFFLAGVNFYRFNAKNWHF